MDTKHTAERAATDRRSFLKVGTLAATPIAALALPAAAQAMAREDASRTALARLEDERAIEKLQRDFLRRFNGAPGADCGEFVAKADAIAIDPAVAAIAEDAADEARLDFAEDGASASYSRACRVEIVHSFEGSSTIEQMSRLQGQGRFVAHETRMLTSELARTKDGGWAITRLVLA